MEYENSKLEKENNCLFKQNDQFKRISDLNTTKGATSQAETAQIATYIDKVLMQFEARRTDEGKHNRIDKKQAQDMSDMVSYVKQLTENMIVLRQRQKNAERIISKYRHSAQTSVQDLLE